MSEVTQHTCHRIRVHDGRQLSSALLEAECVSWGRDEAGRSEVWTPGLDYHWLMFGDGRDLSLLRVKSIKTSLRVHGGFYLTGNVRLRDISGHKHWYWKNVSGR